jgi:hypothetical protein
MGPGSPFVGMCLLCGTEGLYPEDARQRCENPMGVTTGDAFMLALDGEPDSEGPGR